MKRIVSAVVFSALTFGLMAPMVHAADAPAAGATQKPAAAATATPVAKAGDVKAGDVKQDAAQKPVAAGSVKQDTAKPVTTEKTGDVAKPAVKPAS